MILSLPFVPLACRNLYSAKLRGKAVFVHTYWLSSPHSIVSRNSGSTVSCIYIVLFIFYAVVLLILVHTSCLDCRRALSVPWGGGGTQEFEGFETQVVESGDDRHIHDQAPASVGPRSISLDLPVSVFCHSTTQSTKVLRVASLPRV